MEIIIRDSMAYKEGYGEYDEFQEEFEEELKEEFEEELKDTPMQKQ